MLVDWDDDCAHRIKWTRRGGGPEEVKFKMCFCFWSLYSVMKIVIMTKCCRSMTGSWFRSKRFRVEGAPSSLFAVLSPVKRVEEGLSPVRGAEGGLPRGALEEQRPPSLTGERREEQQSEERQEGPRYGDVKDRHEHGDDRHGVGHEDRHKHGEEEQERKPYFPSVSSSYSSTANRQGILFMYWILLYVLDVNFNYSRGNENPMQDLSVFSIGFQLPPQVKSERWPQCRQPPHLGKMHFENH